MSSSFKKNQIIYSKMLLKADRLTHEIYERMKQNKAKKPSTYRGNYTASNTRGNCPTSEKTPHGTTPNSPLGSFKKKMSDFNMPDNSLFMNCGETNEVSESYLKPYTPCEKNSYVNYLNNKNKSSYPFGLTEKRFKWQNLNDPSNLVEPTERKNKIKRINKNYELKYGFEAFYNSKVGDGYNKGKKMNTNIEGACGSYNDHGFKSLRVILPEKNEEFVDFFNKRMQKRRTAYSQKFFNSSEGDLDSLLARTPMFIPIKSKRLFMNKSVHNKSINLFSEDYGRIEIPQPKKGGVRTNRNIVYYDHLNRDRSLPSELMLEDYGENKYKGKFYIERSYDKTKEENEKNCDWTREEIEGKKAKNMKKMEFRECKNNKNGVRTYYSTLTQNDRSFVRDKGNKTRKKVQKLEKCAVNLMEDFSVNLGNLQGKCGESYREVIPYKDSEYPSTRKKTNCVLSRINRKKKLSQSLVKKSGGKERLKMLDLD